MRGKRGEVELGRGVSSAGSERSHELPPPMRVGEADGVCGSVPPVREYMKRVCRKICHPEEGRSQCCSKQASPLAGGLKVQCVCKECHGVGIPPA